MPLAKVNPFTLSEKTHEAGSPWDKTAGYAQIDDQLIKDYYSK